MTNTELEQLLEGQPPDVQEEILGINADARPIALQIALLVPLVAALLGLLNGFRMTRLRRRWSASSTAPGRSAAPSRGLPGCRARLRS